MDNIKKLKEYGFNDVPTPINKENIEELTNNTWDTWLGLTGLFNIKIEDEVFLTIDDLNIIGNSHVLTILCTEKICLTIRADLRNKKIFFEDIHLYQYTGKGIGRIAHKNLVELAKKIGFKEIILEARRSQNNDDFFNGYYTWAKFGYRMIDESHSSFINDMREKGIKITAIGNNKKVDVTCLHHLVYRDCAYWKNKGYSWLGIFELEEKKPFCNKISEMYNSNPTRYHCISKLNP